MSAHVGVVLADLRVGGLQAMAVGLARALDPARFRASVYTFDGGGPLEADLREAGIPHRDLPRGRGVRPGHARVLGRALGADGVDVVHCHNVTALFHGARAAHHAGRLPVLYTEHDRTIPGPLRHRVLHAWLARRVDAVVAVSRRLADALVRWEGFPRARVRHLVNGVADPRAVYGGTRAQARAALGWDARPTALAVGSLTEVKNHVRLIEAFARLAAAPAAREARLRIAGTGPLEEALRAAIGRDDLGGRVELLGERHDVPRLLAAADVFTLPSRSEGLSLSLLEAHGAGRPSVATDVGGNGEVVVDGVTGLLVPPGDPAALADALGALLGDPARARALGEAARARYLEEFTHARMVERYEALLDELAASRVA